MRFISVTDLDSGQLREVIELGLEVKLRPERVVDSLAGRSIGLFFMKPSLRTWVSSDVAAAELGAHPVIIGQERAGLGTREAPEDVGRVLDRYLDLLALRVFDHTDLERLAAVMDAPVVNLLSDREHPCQAVADLMTVAEHRPLAGATIAFVGDGNNVCNSLMLGATMVGARIRVATPPGHAPDPAVVARAAAFGDVDVGEDPLRAVSGADAVYTDVWTSMGEEERAEDRRAAFVPYRVDEELFSAAAADAIFLHCLPAHRGEEVTDGVIDHARSRVFDQAENRLHSFKAILLHLLA